MDVRAFNNLVLPLKFERSQFRILLDSRQTRAAASSTLSIQSNAKLFVMGART